MSRRGFAPPLACVADTILVFVSLAGVAHVGTIILIVRNTIRVSVTSFIGSLGIAKVNVTRIALTIEVRVLLIGIEDEGTIVSRVLYAVTVGVVSSQSSVQYLLES